MSVLSNFEIEAIGDLCHTPLRCVCIDELVQLHPGTIVYNYSKTTDKDGGSHWAGLVCRDGVAYTCDSYGRYPLKEVIDFCTTHGLDLQYNATQIQDNDSVDCGWFATGFVVYMKQNNATVEGWIDKFTRNYRKNDFTLIQYWKQLCNKYNIECM